MKIILLVCILFLFKLNQSQFLCELNTGPNLSQCNASNNSTHTCCLGVPRNGNGNNICTPVEASEETNKDNSNFSNGVESYIVKCKASSVSSTNTKQVQSSYSIPTSDPKWSNFQQNCGNYYPSKPNDCAKFNTDENYCCFIVSQIPNQQFTLCSLYPKYTADYSLDQITRYCLANYTSTTYIQKESSSNSLHLMYSLIKIILIALLN